MYKEIVSTLPYPISFVGDDYKYKAVNKEYTKYYNTSVDNIVGKSVSSFFEGTVFEDEIKPNMDRCLQGQEIIYEVVVPFSSDDVKVMLMHYTPYYDQNNKVIGIVSHGKDITHEKELENRLKSKEAYLNHIFKKSPNISIVTNGEEIDKANDKMLEFVGYKTLYEFKQDHDCICDYFLNGKGLIQAEMKGLTWLEYILQNPDDEHRIAMLKDGKKNYFKIDINQFEFENIDRFKIIFTNITNLFDLENTLHETKNYLEDIFNVNPNITFITNGEELLKANNEFLEFTSFDSVESFKKIYDCICDMFVEKENYITKYVDGQIWVEYIHENSDMHNQAMILKDEKEFIFDINIVKLKDDFLVSLYDVTQIIEKDKLLLCQSRSAAMGDMIGMIAHQWRQPLSVLSMEANNMIADYELGTATIEEFKTYSSSIQEQTEFLSKTIDDFRYFFKSNNEKEPVVLENLIEDTISMMEASFKSHNITINREFNGVGEIIIFKSELSHVLINILTNSKEAFEQYDIKDKRVLIRTNIKNDNVVIEFEDNAGGIEKKIIDKIFEPYFSTKENLNGTGLGLYMSKMIIEDHFKGTIDAINKNGGVMFKVVFRAT